MIHEPVPQGCTCGWVSSWALVNEADALSAWASHLYRLKENRGRKTKKHKGLVQRHSPGLSRAALDTLMRQPPQHVPPL